MFDNADSLVINASDCCGYGWFSNVSKLRLPASVKCGSVPLETAVMSTLCMCKRNAIQMQSFSLPALFPSATQTLCHQVANVTFIPAHLSTTGKGYCSTTGCLPGQRSFRMYELDKIDYSISAGQCQYYAESGVGNSLSGELTVFETFCQGKLLCEATCCLPWYYSQPRLECCRARRVPNFPSHVYMHSLYSQTAS